MATMDATERESITLIFEAASRIGADKVLAIGNIIKATGDLNGAERKLVSKLVLGGANGRKNI